MKQNQIICKNCGNGCFLEIVTEQNTMVSINGNHCDGGKRYAERVLFTAFLETTLLTIEEILDENVLYRDEIWFYGELVCMLGK